MKKEEMKKRAKKVKEKMRVVRVDLITNKLSSSDFLPQERVDAIKEDMHTWSDEQFELVEQFIDIAADHARVKKELHKAKTELQAQNSESFGDEIKLKAQNSGPCGNDIKFNAELEGAKNTILEFAAKIKNTFYRTDASDLAKKFMSDFKEGIKKTEKVIDKEPLEKNAGEKIYNEVKEMLNSATKRSLSWQEKNSPKELCGIKKRHRALHKKAILVKDAEADLQQKINESNKDFAALIPSEEEEANVTVQKNVNLMSSRKVTKLKATRLAGFMHKAGFIEEKAIPQQIEEIRKMCPEALHSLERMINKAISSDDKQKTKKREWGHGSEIAEKHRSMCAKNEEETRDIINKHQKENISESRVSSVTIHPQKPTSEKEDNKTTKEPKFMTELRAAREFLEKFDDTFANAKVNAIKARETLLHEERKYNGTKLHDDTTKLYSLTKTQMKAQRDFAIIDKVYKQAFKAFEQINVEQISVEELNKAFDGYNIAENSTDTLREIWGGEYRTGDDPYYKRLARQRHDIDINKTRDDLKEMLSYLPYKEIDKCGKSVAAIFPFKKKK